MGLAHHPNVVTDGLIGCWDAGNRRSYPATGTTWTDIAGSYNSTLENWAGSSFSSEKLGCLDFDGTDAYAQLSMPATTFSGNGTLSIWMKWNDDVSDGIFAVKGASLAGNYYDGEYWGFQKHVSNASLIRFHTGQAWATTITTDLSDGDWANIVVVYNGSGGSGTCYINGVNKGSLSWSAYSTTDGDAHVGHGGHSNAYYDGEIASVQIYNRQLTAAEVLQNYEAMKPRFVPRITKEGLMYYVDAGDPLCYDGNLANYYAPGTYNLRDLAEGAIGEFSNMNSQYPFFVNANGGYWELDGTNDKICPFAGNSGTPYSRYTTANGITGIMWINLAEDSTNIFFWKDDTFQFRYDNSNKLNMRSGNGTSWSTSADLKSAADLLAADGTEWACVAALANKSNDAREIWLNGERVANDTGSGMVWGTNNNIMGVGSESLGDVAMALLYERALSAAEIKDFYNKTKARFGH